MTFNYCTIMCKLKTSAVSLSLFRTVKHSTAQSCPTRSNFSGQHQNIVPSTIMLILGSCWRDRIPFVFLFGVATSISNFQAKLSRKATRCIRGQRFDVVKAETALEQVFEVLHSKRPTLWIGPGLCTAMLRRQRDHVQSLTALLDSIHVSCCDRIWQ